MNKSDSKPKIPFTLEGQAKNKTEKQICLWSHINIKSDDNYNFKVVELKEFVCKL